jgi:hypothetical protein
MPTQFGPGAQVGAAEADNRVAEQLLDITAPAPDQTVVRLLRWQRQIEAIYRLGPRVFGKLLDEIARYHNLRDDIDRRLAQYAGLDPVTVSSLGADRFPPAPLHLLMNDDG